MRTGRGDLDLFGNPTYDSMPIGELILEWEVIPKLDEICSRIDWAIENLPETGNLLLDVESHLLLGDARQSFYFGAFAACVLCSMAFNERLLTDAVEIRGDLKAARSGFGSVIKATEKMGILHPFLVSRLFHLNRARVNLSHEKGPESEYSLFRRWMRQRIVDDIDPNFLIMRDDAREALCLAHGIASMIPRYFPRLNLPGHPEIREEILERQGIFHI